MVKISRNYTQKKWRNKGSQITALKNYFKFNLRRLTNRESRIDHWYNLRPVWKEDIPLKDWLLKLCEFYSLSHKSVNTLFFAAEFSLFQTNCDLPVRVDRWLDRHLRYARSNNSHVQIFRDRWAGHSNASIRSFPSYHTKGSFDERKEQSQRWGRKRVCRYILCSYYKNKFWEEKTVFW